MPLSRGPALHKEQPAAVARQRGVEGIVHDGRGRAQIARRQRRGGAVLTHV